MAKRRRRDHQHLGQETAKRKARAGTPTEVYKPGFPMNIFGNLKLFSIIGVGVVVIMVAAALFTTQFNQSASPDDEFPTATPTATVDPNATPTATVDPSATPSPTEEALQWTEPEQVIDAATTSYEAVIETSKGSFTIALDAENAPATVNSFVFLANNDYFDGVLFHRIVSNFIAQSGDPTGTGSGSPGYSVPEEANQISNTRGTVSMAKARGATSFGSQFFINLKDNTSLDYTAPQDKFYPFGTVSEGMDIVDQIGAAGSASQEGTPTEEITIIDVVINETPRQ